MEAEEREMGAAMMKLQMEINHEAALQSSTSVRMHFATCAVVTITVTIIVIVIVVGTLLLLLLLLLL